MTKRIFNRTRVAKKNCPKRKTLKTNKGLLRMRVKSKNEDPAYSRQGTRAKDKAYKIANIGIRPVKIYKNKKSKVDRLGEQDCD